MKAQDSIFFLLNKASQSGTRCLAKKLSAFSVTPAQGLILIFLLEEDALKSTVLGERAGLDSATLTGIIDRLERRDLVRRRKNPSDRRAIRICLSDRGAQIAKEIYTETKTANQAFLSDLSDIEKKIFRSLLRRVHAK